MRESLPQILYEAHKKADAQFPFILHEDFLNTSCNRINEHWHESLELLFITRGEVKVYSASLPKEFRTGELAVINSGDIHSIEYIGEKSSYYCLIVDKSFTDSLDILVNEKRFAQKAVSTAIQDIFSRIIDEWVDSSEYFRLSIKALVIELLVELCRSHICLREKNTILSEGVQINIVKQGIEYMQHNFQHNLSLDEICSEIGYSKYYFCRLFRQYTGKSVMDYLQRYRCEYARGLLLSGRYNVGESARLCGIPHLSHFSKMYQRYMGVLPKADTSNTK